MTGEDKIIRTKYKKKRPNICILPDYFVSLQYENKQSKIHIHLIH